MALGLQVVLTHETADLLGINENAAMAQLGANPAIAKLVEDAFERRLSELPSAVDLELIADRDHVRDDLGVISLQRQRVTRGLPPTMAAPFQSQSPTLTGLRHGSARTPM